VRIGEIFRRPIDRRIEEVIKVDLDEEAVVAEEIDEYVVTEHIAEAFEGVLDRYQETILRPDEGTNIWVSGFFGSGKSSFAKILGYLLANPTVAGRSATQRFLARVDSRRIEALLNTIHAQAATKVVFVDLSTGKDVLNEGESIVLPLYRALLTDLGYSRNPLLAELEYDLETDGDLDTFVEAFGSIPDGKGTWHKRRNSGLARGEASHAMHLLRPGTFPRADSWSRSAQPSSIDANWFARRAVELLGRRGGGAARLVFVVDEAGQYVARSVQRMLDLQDWPRRCRSSGDTSGSLSPPRKPLTTWSTASRAGRSSWHGFRPASRSGSTFFQRTSTRWPASGSSTRATLGSGRFAPRSARTNTSCPATYSSPPRLGPRTWPRTSSCACTRSSRTRSSF
jgi:hypothetical protein